MHSKQTAWGQNTSDLPGTTRVMKFVSPTAGLTETRAGIMHSVDRHAGMFNEKIFHRTGFHLDSG